MKRVSCLLLWAAVAQAGGLALSAADLRPLSPDTPRPADPALLSACPGLLESEPNDWLCESWYGEPDELPCGSTVCGTTRVVEGLRDLDSFHFQLLADGPVSIELAPGAFEAWLMLGTCVDESLEFLEVRMADAPGQMQVIELPVLAAGDYLVVVTASFDELPDPQPYQLALACGDPGTVAADEQPLDFSLAAHPNPFNPSTRLAFNLPDPGEVHLRIFDLTGAQVAELAQGWLDRGAHELVWDAAGQASGVYLAVLEAGGQRQVRKLTLLR